MFFLFFNDTATTDIYPYVHTLSLHDALPISGRPCGDGGAGPHAAGPDHHGHPDAGAGGSADDSRDPQAMEERAGPRHVGRRSYGAAGLSPDRQGSRSQRDAHQAVPGAGPARRRRSPATARRVLTVPPAARTEADTSELQ